MLDYIYGHDKIVSDFVASLIPECQGRGLPKASTSIGVIEDGRLVAGFVYHHYDPESGVIEISCAALLGKQWLSRETVRRIYQYPFLQLGCQMVIGRVAADNTRLLRQMEALNYAFKLLPRLLGRDRDAVYCYLTREAWEESKFNRRLRHDAALEEAA